MDIEYSDDINPEIGYFNHRKCLPDWNISEDTIDFYDVTYVVGGGATYTVNGQELRIAAGDLMCIPPGSTRSAVMNRENPMECYAANFQITGQPGKNTVFTMPLINHIGLHPDIISIYDDLKYVWLRRNHGYMIEAKALLLRILVSYLELSVQKGRPFVIDYRAEKAARYIIDHYAEDISIDTLAAITGLNKNYFGALFKEAMGMTFRQFLTSIRLNRADTLLLISKNDIESIASRCGFTDVCYFSKVFKKKRGISPSQYRQQKGEL